MSLSTRIVLLTQAIGSDIKQLVANQGNLASLTTTSQDSIVSAINELHVMVNSAGIQINDAAGNGDTTVTWSADKIFDTIEIAKAAIKNELTNGAGAALDTLSELAAALGNDANFASTVAADIGNRVRFDAAQTLTTPQQAQACANIGIGDPETDLAAAYATAKA